MISIKVAGLFDLLWSALRRNNCEDLDEFDKNIIKFQSLFHCCVCKQLLVKKEVFSTTCHDHFACGDCLRKERNEDGKCKKCEDWSKFQRDTVLEAIIKSFQDLCHYCQTDDVSQILELKHEMDPSFEIDRLYEIFLEGAEGHVVEEREFNIPKAKILQESSSRQGLVNSTKGSKRKPKSKAIPPPPPPHSTTPASASLNTNVVMAVTSNIVGNTQTQMPRKNYGSTTPASLVAVSSNSRDLPFTNKNAPSAPTTSTSLPGSPSKTQAPAQQTYFTGGKFVVLTKESGGGGGGSSNPTMIRIVSSPGKNTVFPISLPPEIFSSLSQSQSRSSSTSSLSQLFLPQSQSQSQSGLPSTPIKSYSPIRLSPASMNLTTQQIIASVSGVGVGGTSAQGTSLITSVSQATASGTQNQNQSQIARQVLPVSSSSNQQVLTLGMPTQSQVQQPNRTQIFGKLLQTQTSSASSGGNAVQILSKVGGTSQTPTLFVSGGVGKPINLGGTTANQIQNQKLQGLPPGNFSQVHKVVTVASSQVQGQGTITSTALDMQNQSQTLIRATPGGTPTLLSGVRTFPAANQNQNLTSTVIPASSQILAATSGACGSLASTVSSGDSNLISAITGTVQGNTGTSINSIRTSSSASISSLSHANQSPAQVRRKSTNQSIDLGKTVWTDPREVNKHHSNEMRNIPVSPNTSTSINKVSYQPVYQSQTKFQSRLQASQSASPACVQTVVTSGSRNPTSSPLVRPPAPAGVSVGVGQSQTIRHIISNKVISSQGQAPSIGGVPVLRAVIDGSNANARPPFLIQQISQSTASASTPQSTAPSGQAVISTGNQCLVTNVGASGGSCSNQSVSAITSSPSSTNTNASAPSALLSFRLGPNLPIQYVPIQVLSQNGIPFSASNSPRFVIHGGNSQGLPAHPAFAQFHQQNVSVAPLNSNVNVTPISTSLSSSVGTGPSPAKITKTEEKSNQ